jgi:hypothetical protein
MLIASRSLSEFSVPLLPECQAHHVAHSMRAAQQKAGEHKRNMLTPKLRC